MSYPQPLMTLQPQHHPLTPDHAVPFGQPQPQRNSLLYGFGLPPPAAATSTWPHGAGQLPVGQSWGTPASPWRGATPSGSAGVRSSPVPSSPATVPASRRRRRSATPDSEAEDRMEGFAARVSPVRGLKKARVVVAAAGVVQAEEEASFLPAGPVVERDGADLGKALASLSKPSLLKLLENLLTAHPALHATISSLVPPPTLPSTLTTLATLERAVLDALPTGQGLRDTYILGRVRVPLEEYVNDTKSFLATFCPPTLPSSVPDPDDIHHPSTTFALLHALTSSIRRLEHALPSGPSSLSTHLLPYAINAWHIFLTRLNAAVNIEGRVLSANLLKSWLGRLDELCVPSPGVLEGTRREGAARKALAGVRERIRREVGWLVGIKEVMGERMDDEEEL